MEELKDFYRKLLHVGLLTLRRAIYSENAEWAKLEVEMLHNLPDLLAEEHIEHHRYYWFIERDIYIQRVSALRSDEPKSCMRTFYEPIWQEMEPVLLAVLQSAEKQSNGIPTLQAPNPPSAATAPAR